MKRFPVSSSLFCVPFEEYCCFLCSTACRIKETFLICLSSQHLSAFHCLLFLYHCRGSVLARQTAVSSGWDLESFEKQINTATTHKWHLSLIIFFTLWTAGLQSTMHSPSPSEQLTTSYYRFVKQYYCDNWVKSRKVGLIACYEDSGENKFCWDYREQRGGKQKQLRMLWEKVKRSLRSMAEELFDWDRMESSSPDWHL